MGIELPVATISGFPPVDAYVIIDRVDFSRVNQTLVLWAVGFPSKAILDRRQAARLRALDLVKSLPMMPNPKEFDDHDDFERALRDYQKECAAIQRDLKAAQAEAMGPPPIALPGVTVPPQEVAALLGDDGMPDLARCYEWLAARPEFADGKAS